MASMSTTAVPAPPSLHPLSPLNGDEIKAARQIVFDSGRAVVANEALRFAYVGLCDPPKDVVRAVDRGEPAVVDRQVRMVLLQGPEADVVEAIVSVTRGEVVRLGDRRGRPPAAADGGGRSRPSWPCTSHAEWNAALDRRGIADRSLVQVDPWPAGTFGLDHEKGRRITSASPTCGSRPTTTATPARSRACWPSSTWGGARCSRCSTSAWCPIPPTSGSYYPEDNGPLRTDLKPLVITQPEGPSFEVEGNLVRWQKWSLRVGMDPLEGLVLSTIGYEDGGRVRPIVYRASVSEMVVPYGHPGPMHAWKSAFDAGEWGLGRMANSLTLGCDCLGEIHYFDDVFADERGKPRTRRNAICMHEEDYSILWKHVDMMSGRTEVRRSRRLVISSIATVGNYEYGFYWYFYLDGTMQLEVKLTGIMSTMAVDGDDPGEHAGWWRPAWPRRSTSTSSTCGSTSRSTAPTTPSSRSTPCRRRRARGTPSGTRSGPTATLLDTELAARRDVDPVASSHLAHRQSQPAQRPSGQPTAYKLLPGATPTLLADPESSVGRRAAFAAHNLWVTPFDPDERRAAGDYPNQHAGGAGSAGLDGAGPLRWSTPTSCCGIPSGSPTSRGPRTGR